MVSIEAVDREAMRQMIIEMKDGALSEDDTKALESCTAYASHLWVGYIRDVPVCAWGLVPPTLISDCAYLWLYATPGIDEHKFIFVRNSQVVMEQMRAIYPTIYGVTDVNDRRAIRWLRWLGAKFGVPKGQFVKFLIGEIDG